MKFKLGDLVNYCTQPKVLGVVVKVTDYNVSVYWFCNVPKAAWWNNGRPFTDDNPFTNLKLMS